MNIAAVIVTYNRLNMLKGCLDAYIEQECVPEYIIVVNNASTDGTGEYLEQWKNTHAKDSHIVILHMDKNLGGSGGFHAGMQEALKLDADWICVGDDDAYPAKDVFLKAKQHIAAIASEESVSAICTQVEMGGVTDISHRNNRCISQTKVLFEPVAIAEYAKSSFYCDSASYVGLIIKASVLSKAGLTEKNFFIWHDDAEHCWRLSSMGKIVCYPDMVMDHRVNKQDYEGISWKTYYGYRNYMLMIKKHLGMKYFLIYIVRTLSRGPRSLSWKHTKLAAAAVLDAIANKQGIHKIYKPGWK